MEPASRPPSNRGYAAVPRQPLFLALLLFLLSTPFLGRAASLGNVGNLPNGTEDTPYTISYSGIAAQANESSDTIAFQMRSVTSGTLTVGGVAVTNLALLTSAQNWIWTPPLNANGNLDAFKIRAWDGTNASSSDVQVTVSVAAVNDPPTISQIQDASINEDGTFTSPDFTVNDEESNANSLTLSASSSNTTLVPTTNITFPDNTGSSRSIQVVPAMNQSGTVVITVTVSDGSDSTSTNFTLMVTAVNDAPTLTSVSTLTGATEDTPFTVTYTALAAAANEADIDGPTPLSFRLEKVDNGSMTKGETPVTPGSTLLSSTGDPWIWTPADNISGNINAFKIRAWDGSLASSADVQVMVSVAEVPEPPAVTLTISPTNILENKDAFPFTLLIGDSELNNSSYTVYLEATNASGNFLYGTIDPPGPFTGNRDAVQQAIRSVRYTAGSAAVGAQLEVFQARVVDSMNGVGTDQATLTVLGVNDPPQIEGVSGIIFTTDDPSVPPVRPFSSVVIQDPDLSQSLAVTIAMDDNTKGTLSASSVTGTDRAMLISQLRAITFRPSRLGRDYTAVLTLRVTDGVVSRLNDGTSVAVTFVNRAPVINGIPESQPVAISPTPPVNPFRGIAVQDEDTNAIVLTVTLDNAAKGAFTNFADVGFSIIGPGSYRIIAPDDIATLALRNLAFQVNTNFSFPPATPGATTFGLAAQDFRSLSSSASLSIVLRDELRNHLVTLDTDDMDANGDPEAGSLRQAILSANNGDIITFALPTYPALIRLNATNGPLLLNRSLSLKGPGANLLTISGDSNGDLQPDTQIFRVTAEVALEGMTLAHGAAFGDEAVTGGAIYVGAEGRLVMRYCAITDSRAAQWGGAIDVEEGSLSMEHCLLRNNATDATFGLGGGAVSLYTDLACFFINTTFSANRQESKSGFGGGALYVQNLTSSTDLDVEVSHATFSENFDAVALGSSIHSKEFGSLVKLKNSIFADGRGRNLEVNGRGRIVSLGGNLSDDEATTNLGQGGLSDQTIFLNQFTDLRLVNPLLGAFDPQSRPVPGYPLQAGSPAIGWAVYPAEATDQRGVIRDDLPDAGALEFNATARLAINEIQAQGNDGDFIEFYVLRDSVPVDLSGYQLWVDGTNRHVFASGSVVKPGFGIIVANSNISAAGTPVMAPPSQSSSLFLRNPGLVELKKPDPDGRTVLLVTYAKSFVDPEAPSQYLDHVANNSLTLAPQFVGFAYLPSSVVLAPPLGGADLTVRSDTNSKTNTPGRDATLKIFGSPNSPPAAVEDFFLVNEDELSTLPVLNNDLDADGTDRLVLVDVSTSLGQGGNNASIPSTNGAIVRIAPTNAVPLRAGILTYDPRHAVKLQSLSEGAKGSDEFTYTIVDVGLGPIESFAGTAGSQPLTVTALEHGMASSQRAFISGAGVAAYNGIYTITVLDTNRFTIPVAYLGTNQVTGYQGTVGLSPTTLSLTGHGLVNGARIRITGSSTPAYNGVHVITRIDANTLTIPVVFVDNAATKGAWSPVDAGSWGRVLTSGMVGGYAGVIGAAPVIVSSPAHGLADGEQVFITGSEGGAYDGQFTVRAVDTDHFALPITFSTNPNTKGSWLTVAQRSPTSTSETKVNVTVLGANDFPTPGFDVVTGVTEESIVRILGDAAFTTQPNRVYDTDGNYPTRPAVSGTSLLPNDQDPDADDDAATLKVVGVLGQVQTITNFSGTVGSSPVTVSSPGHGLTDGDVILISGYDGHPSYNGFHAVTVVDENTFTIPILYVDNGTLQRPSTNPPFPSAVIGSDARAVWAVLNDDNRLAAVSAQGAEVTLEIRTDRRETSMIYNPRTSSSLNGLSLGTSDMDIFFYAVEDRHGAVSLATVELQVNGVNDLPNVTADPASLAALDALVNSDRSLEDVVAGLDVLYRLAPASALPGRADTQVEFDDNGTINSFFLQDLWTISEDGMLFILSADLLANDGDLDRNDTLRIKSVTPLSRLGASLLRSGNGAMIAYDPRSSTNLDMLAREELVIDTFEVTVTDDEQGDVTSLVSVLVVGANDTPRPQDDYPQVYEDTPFVFNPIFFPLDNPALYDQEDDINGVAPDNHLSLIAVTNATTDIPDALVNVAGDLITYDPTQSEWINGLGQGQSQIDTFIYTVVDNSFIFANDDLFKVEADSADNSLEVLVNDRNLTGNGGALRISAVGTPSQRGSVSIVDAGARLVYTPEVNFVGDDIFTYTVTDDFGNTDGGLVVVRVTVNQLNGNLQANADHFTVARGEAPSLDVLANDNIRPLDGEGLVITRVVVAPDQNGQAVVENNRITYTPDVLTTQAFPYTETFTYEISGGGTARALAVVTIQVKDRSGTLYIRDDSFSVEAGSRDNRLDVLINDNILPGTGEALTLTGVITTTINGQVSVSDEGDALLYSPNPGFIGEETFLYEVTDGLGGTGRGRVRISVGNLALSGDFFALAYNDPLTNIDDETYVLDVLANDAVLQSAPTLLTISDVSPMNSAIGTMSIQSGWTNLLFTPKPGAEGEQAFTYLVTDGFGRTASANVTVVVFRDGVRANSDNYTVGVDSQDNELNVLANDVAVPDRGRKLIIVEIGTGLNAPNRGGTVVRNETNDRLIYTPAPGFVGEETFTYTMTDSKKTDTAKVVIRVSVGELSANGDAYTVFFEIPDSPSALLSASDIADVGALVNALVAMSEPSMSLIAGFSSATLDALAGYPGTVTDNQLTTLLVNDLNAIIEGPSIYDPVRFTNVVLSVETRELLASDPSSDEIARLNRLLLQDAYPTGIARPPATQFTLPVLSNDRVLPDLGQLLTITDVGLAELQASNAPALPGSMTISADGSSLIYLPRDEFSPFPYVETFQYEISDGTTRRAEATIVIEVQRRTAERDIETNDDEYTVAADSQDNLLDVLANDNVKPANADGWSITGVTESAFQGVVLVVGNTISYTPQPGFVGTDWFVYAVSDGFGGTGIGIVSVNVGELPVCDDLFTVLSGTTDNILDVLANDAIRPATSSNFKLLSVGGADAGGQVSVDQETLRYTPAASPSGAYPFRENFHYLIEDDSMGMVTGRVSVIVHQSGSDRAQAVVYFNVNGVNDAPVIAGTVSGQTTYYRLPVQPFSGVTVSDVDRHGEEPLWLTVTLDDPTHGVMQALGGFIDRGNGVYTLGGPGNGLTPTQATSALRALQFLPTTADRVSPGVSETTRFTLQVEDGWAEPVLDDNTTVIAIHSYQGKFPTAEGQNDDTYGFATAATRDLVAVGAPLDTQQGVIEAGSVYLLARNEGGPDAWGQIQKLNAADFSGQDNFGFSVAMDHETIVVGARFAPKQGRDTGAVYIFQRRADNTNLWEQVQKLVPSDGVDGDQFGTSVALDGDLVAIGARRDDDLGEMSGSVYLFRRGLTTPGVWSQMDKLLATEGNRDDLFGHRVALQGNLLVVGAPDANPNNLQTGAAYLFRPSLTNANHWVQAQRLLPADGAAGDNFGWSAAISGHIVVVGAPYNLDVIRSGSVYVYEPNPANTNQWALAKKVLPPERADSDAFGNSVSIDRDLLVVGGPLANLNQTDSGSAWIFDRNQNGAGQWGLLEKLLPALVDSQDQFGFATALSENTAVIGAPYDEGVDLRTGSVYIYRLKYNNAPQVAMPIADQVGRTNQLFTLVVPPGTFADPDVADQNLVLGACLADGSPLPSWLHFDPATGTFSGTPDGAEDSYVIKVTATDEDGLVVALFFTLSIPDGEGGSDGGEWSVQLGIGHDPAAGDILVGYQRPLNSTPGLYLLEASNDLLLWTDGGPLVKSQEVVQDGPDTEMVVLRIDRTLVPGGTKFFRVRKGP